MQQRFASAIALVDIAATIRAIVSLATILLSLIRVCKQLGAQLRAQLLTDENEQCRMVARNTVERMVGVSTSAIASKSVVHLTEPIRADVLSLSRLFAAECLLGAQQIFSC